MERVYELYGAINGLQEISKETRFFNLTRGYDIQQKQKWKEKTPPRHK
jgi:hypothetical protein